ncbi:hypothetical protein [Nocardia sp. alder85J]|uniref:hypothetical protein n=1 Tax=Nocardia sp. alder85J TaxID=2862949 RepID=UPI001CD645E3|nr:hypothetical protein [Nocardia sp. alder85J]MCX4093998.1 hypothetical protein [Nocardia sp. alder85J]
MQGKTPPTEPLSTRERRRLLVVAAVVTVIVAAGLAAWTLFDRSPDYNRSGNGCVAVESASSMGGGVQRACGDQARTWCASVADRSDAQSAEVRRQCRIAGIPA